MASAVGAIHQQLIFDRRTRVLARHFAELLPAGVVLDVGCGDGTIDVLIQEQRPDVAIRGVDVLVRPATKIPVEAFDGRHLPFADKSFDAVMFVDVLHHTDDPSVLIREAKRVARNAVTVKDHTMDGPLAYSTLRLMDWVGNAHHGVALPYNYWPERRWREAFAAVSLKPKEWRRSVGLYPFPASLIFDRGLHFVTTLEPAV